MTKKPLTQDTTLVKGAVWLGQRSYGIHVYHWPTVMLGLWLGAVIDVPLPIIGLVLIAVVLIASEASFSVDRESILQAQGSI